MLNYIWAVMIFIGILYAMLTGNIDKITDGALNSAGEAVSLCITMLGVMSLWCGLMEIAGKSGLIAKCRKAIGPVMCWLFPCVPKESEAMEYITTNMISNFLGLGWAATPAGIKAMKALAKLNNGNSVASNDMCTFLIINISSVQLIPVNIIAYRSQYGSVSPESIVMPAIIATTISTAAAVIFCRLFGRQNVGDYEYSPKKGGMHKKL